MTTTPTLTSASRRLARPALAVIVAAVAALAGCASNVPLDNKGGAAVENRDPNANANPNSGANAGGVPQSNVTSVDLSDKSASADSNLSRIVYFDFDSFVIKDEYKPLLEGHAKALAALRAKKVTIEGHTDERGGSEYNLALGQKRAEAVAKGLALLGVPDSQVEAVSFGKERPADAGHDEAAWAKNRRAELKDR